MENRVRRGQGVLGSAPVALQNSKGRPTALLLPQWCHHGSWCYMFSLSPDFLLRDSKPSSPLLCSHLINFLPSFLPSPPLLFCQLLTVCQLLAFFGNNKSNLAFWEMRGSNKRLERAMMSLDLTLTDSGHTTAGGGSSMCLWEKSKSVADVSVSARSRPLLTCTSEILSLCLSFIPVTCGS